MANTQTPENEITLTAKRTCDVVMKGGITSGIVYPRGIYELAKEYRFVNIGGNSAGAIAACLTAAAEYDRRENKSANGFKALNDLPANLGKNINGKSKLFSLFQPNRSTKKTFDILLKLFEQRTIKGKIISGIFIFFKKYFLTVILSAIPGIIVLCFLSGIDDGALKILSVMFVALGTMLIVILSVLIKFIIDANGSICKNNFGLTKGFIKESTIPERPLTEWLADYIDEVAGKKNKDEPLTFGDLKGKSEDHSINLKMITTNLTWGKPHNLPFETSDVLNAFYYDPDELGKFFPDKIIKWMNSKSEHKLNGKLKLPPADHIPIVVGARMSLCFPVLISVVPLYAVDQTMKANEKEPKLEKCIFSDGGICSNFPVHLFDSPLPSRPTFAFNLNQFHPEHPKSNEESENIYLPNSNRGGINSNWNRNINSLMKFVFSIFDTMQNWTDNTQTTVPGYRDRIVQIHLSNDEGGLNLNMEENVIFKLSERGKFAGIKLRERFTGVSSSDLDWNNHRWIRFRTSLCLLEDHLTKIEKSLMINTTEIEKSYIDLLNRNENEKPKSYEFSHSQKDFANEYVKKIQELTKMRTDKKVSFCIDDVPKPQPELRIRPRI